MSDEQEPLWHEIPFTAIDDVHVLLDGRELELKRFYRMQIFDPANNWADRPRIYIELKEKDRKQ